MRLIVTCALSVLLIGAAPRDRGVALYADALRVFAPSLAPERAQTLAARVIIESQSAALDARLIVALVAVESSWNPHAVSRSGARGLGQLMPQTAAGLGVDPDDPEANLHGAVEHLAGLLAHYRRLDPQAQYEHALAAYNAGAGAVDRYGGIPPYPETQLYVRRVIRLWRRLCGL